MFNHSDEKVMKCIEIRTQMLVSGDIFSEVPEFPDKGFSLVLQRSHKVLQRLSQCIHRDMCVPVYVCFSMHARECP